MAVYLLDDDDIWFPDPYLGDEEDNGLIAVGGDLQTERLLLAYSHGIFPWYGFKEHGMPMWFCPLERFVIFPKDIHISHSMKQLIMKRAYRVTFNEDFDGVIHGCATVKGRREKEGAWLGEDMIEAYKELHRLGYAKSVEVWKEQPEGERKLAGGLYGVTLRGAFFGESMFSLEPNTSKLALIALAGGISGKKYNFIDCQFETAHLRSMGGRHISYREYMALLDPE